MIHKQAAINTVQAILFAVMFTGAVYSALYILPGEVTVGIIMLVTICSLINLVYKTEKHRLETLDRLRKL